MNHIHTNLHPVHFMHDMHNIWEHLLQAKQYSKILLLTDANTSKHCLPLFREACPCPQQLHHVQMPAGEAHKSLEQAQAIWQQMLQLGIDRSALLINVGGGVVSDLGGWVAANYKRGIEVVNLPTSLLAMVDASAGGKTAINFQSLKNMIGLFSPPQAVYINPVFLNTLPQAQLRSGFGEMIKHALIFDADYWRSIQAIHSIRYHTVEPLVYKSVEIKATIVDADPYEKAARKKLNFGHTVGHLFEHWAMAAANKPLLHGEAVALGMWVETYMSMQKAGLSFGEADAVMQYIRSHYEKYPLAPHQLHNMHQVLMHDKKTRHQQWHFTLLTHIGQAETDFVCSVSDVEQALLYYIDNY